MTLAWYDPTNHHVSTDKNDPLFTPLGQLWPLDAAREWVGLTNDEAANELRRLHQCLRNVYEVWAGSEGIPAPTVASEAYLLSLVEQMREAAREGLK